MQGKSANLPGEVCHQAGRGNSGQEIRLRRQKSAEAIVPEPSRREGPNIKKGCVLWVACGMNPEGRNPRIWGLLSRGGK